MKTSAQCKHRIVCVGRNPEYHLVHNLSYLALCCIILIYKNNFFIYQSKEYVSLKKTKPTNNKNNPKNSKITTKNPTKPQTQQKKPPNKKQPNKKPQNQNPNQRRNNKQTNSELTKQKNPTNPEQLVNEMASIQTNETIQGDYQEINSLDLCSSDMENLVFDFYHFLVCLYEQNHLISAVHSLTRSESKKETYFTPLLAFPPSLSLFFLFFVFVY